MFQWAVSLEITGACPAPGRFSSELSSLCFKGLWFPKMPGVSCNIFPQWQNGFQAQPHVSAANAPVQHFPSFRWLAGIRFPDGWRGPDRQWSYRRCTWTPQSAWQKKHQSISMKKDICKTSPVNNLIFFESQPSTMIWLLLVLVACYHYCSDPLTATQVY